MKSRMQPGDEQNGSFESVARPSQDGKPGMESSPAGQSGQASTGGGERRSPGDAKVVPQASLAKRIREREGK
jgi:hypothetical protein